MAIKFNIFNLPREIQEPFEQVGDLFPLGTQHYKDSSVTSAKIANATVADTDLASPNNSVYRLLLTGAGPLGAAAGANTYGFPAAGAGMLGTGANQTQPINVFYLAAASYTVAGKTTKLNVQGQALTNGTAPAVTFTFGLHPITAVAGAAGGLTYTIGAATAGSTAAIATPALSTRNHNEGADFDIPADGYYCLGVVTSGGATAASSFTMLTAQLQIRHT